MGLLLCMRHTPKQIIDNALQMQRGKWTKGQGGWKHRSPSVCWSERSLETRWWTTEKKRGAAAVQQTDISRHTRTKRGAFRGLLFLWRALKYWHGLADDYYSCMAYKRTHTDTNIIQTSTLHEQQSLLARTALRTKQHSCQDSFFFPFFQEFVSFGDGRRKELVPLNWKCTI